MSLELKTGDLLLFTDQRSGLFNFFLDLIRWGTHSNMVHIGMILRDPVFIHPSLKGLYVWESSWEGEPDPQDGKIKLGVQITPYEEILKNYKKDGHIFVRRIEYTDNPFTAEKLAEIHKVVYDRPYDIIPSDWIGALLKKDSHPQKTDRFWCSALVGYIYTQVGILAADTDWSILTPNDFSLAGESLNILDGFSLSKTEERIA